MSEVKALHSKICSSCNKPILKGERYYDVLTPEGAKLVHEKCLDGGAAKQD